MSVVDYSVMNLPQEYVNAADTFLHSASNDSTPLAVLCGGKNVGKSTFTRYLVNRMLNSCSVIAYMECDPGQCEFTPSGCVSLSLIRRPLLGPPFSHNQWPDRVQYFGGLSPSYNAGWYVKCIHEVYQFYHNLPEKVPLIVNTMGWNKGLGLTLFIETVKTVAPTHIIQLEHRTLARNYPIMGAEFVQETPGWVTNKQNGDESFVARHELIIVKSPVNQTNDIAQQALHPKDHRNLMLFSYLGGLWPRGVTDHSLQALVPYQVGWGQVALCVAHCTVVEEQMMYALNASMVALCVLEEDQLPEPVDEDLPRFLQRTPKCQCVGFGIIRGINPVKKVFYLVTPLPLSQLQAVNCLVRGALEIPQQLVLKQSSANGEVPYVGESKDTLGASSVSRRRHMMRAPRKNTQS